MQDVDNNPLQRFKSQLKLLLAASPMQSVISGPNMHLRLNCTFLFILRINLNDINPTE